ncbi:MAG: Fe-S cluster assembly ATPase SufC [Firmicutes bacterium]|nr:Fe-S cluster assembly ATPase SufC [Bacillota bacterium]
MAILEIENLSAQAGETPILRGVDLTVRSGEVHALMGPNGSGKSTLSNVIMGHPAYQVTGGDVRLDGRSILSLPTHERALAGLFLAFQYPIAVSGVSVANFIRTAVNARRTRRDPEDRGVPLGEFMRELRAQMARLDLDAAFAGRYLNDGFSGGEKKRLEMLQLAMLRPSLAILDEPDSGLDIDAVRTVASGVEALRGPDIGFLIITHYQRILTYVRPDRVHVMVGGRIVRSGGQELAQELEAQGYDWLKRETEDAAV